MSIAASTGKVLILAMALATLAGCASREGREKKELSPEEGGSGIVGQIPPDSDFAKIEIGMSMQNVIDLIGHATETRPYVTGKAWIPFYYGRDRSRTDAHYKDLGVITYTSDSRVYRVVYDPTEDGYSSTR